MIEKNYVTEDYYNNLHEDYKTVIKCVYYIVTLDKQSGATVLLPVNLVEKENAFTRKTKERYNIV